MENPGRVLLCLVVTGKSFGQKWQRRSRKFLFTSPGVYACGKDAKISLFFSLVPFRGRGLLGQFAPTRPSSPPEGGWKKKEILIVGSLSTGVNAWASEKEPSERLRHSHPNDVYATTKVG